MRRYLHFLPVVLWMLIIFSLSSRQKLSVSEEQTINFLFFKTLHIIEYAFLFFLTYRALYLGKFTKRYTGHIALFIVFCYAVTDELHQTLVPTREGHPRDVIIDVIGAGFAWMFIEQCIQKLPKKPRNLLRKWQVL